MGVLLLFAREKNCHNSIVTLLGALEREGLAGQCAVRLTSHARLIEDYAEAAASADRVLVGLSMATADAPRLVALLRDLRPHLRPNDLVLAGGPHSTAEDEAVLAAGADVVFRGEADRSFPQFVQAVVTGGNWRDCPGLTFRNAGQIVRTPPPEPVALDEVRSRFQSPRLIGSLEITRGCPYGCGFCQTPRLWGRTPRHRSLESILDELPHYRHSGYVRFLSPNAFGWQARRPAEPNVRAIVEMLEAARARHPMLLLVFGLFPSEVRPDYVRRELVREIRPLVANRYLAVGAQSGSDRVLHNVGRGHTAADAFRAVETILAEGMGVLVDVLFGLPGETPADAALTRRFMERFAPSGVRFRVHVFTPLPGTPLAAAEPNALDGETRAFLDEMGRRGVVEGAW
ncbi:MAG: TIGR04013 family B12-binding domain/radical SAM domain-containing protein [Candidatus Sumerlaeia bacterium]|nr:TIGR04013 family B12-binding domain/radical SAM domain-containing protein [Candidatus Sumerlaeia bacterium]